MWKLRYGSFMQIPEIPANHSEKTPLKLPRKLGGVYLLSKMVSRMRRSLLVAVTTWGRLAASMVTVEACLAADTPLSFRDAPIVLGRLGRSPCPAVFTLRSILKWPN